MNNNFTDEFKSAIREAGLTPPEVVKPRKCCRFPTNGDPRDDAGWCLLFADLQGGCSATSVLGFTDIGKQNAINPLHRQSAMLFGNDASKHERSEMPNSKRAMKPQR